ncbi:MAG TPA: YtxH domain-containing protein [Thermomicrobiales bacterium]|jgi:gas vesicle protein|nr:YtxH domain-containing protein [Thermomicrobiales bacterium]
MFDRSRTATKFFFYGLAIGLLFAPASGTETRGRVIAWASQTVRDTVSGLMGGQSSH